MKLKIIQNQIWRFNLLSKEESLTFIVWIVWDDWKSIKWWKTECEYPKDISARLYFSYDDECEYNSDYLSDLFDTFSIAQLISECEKKIDIPSLLPKTIKRILNSLQNYFKIILRKLKIILFKIGIILLTNKYLDWKNKENYH